VKAGILRGIVCDDIKPNSFRTVGYITSCECWDINGRQHCSERGMMYLTPLYEYLWGLFLSLNN
jgi:hypothetical protein